MYRGILNKTAIQDNTNKTGKSEKDTIRREKVGSGRNKTGKERTGQDKAKTHIRQKAKYKQHKHSPLTHNYLPCPVGPLVKNRKIEMVKNRMGLRHRKGEKKRVRNTK